MKKKIKVAIAGVGSCASALIQGIEYYIQTNDPVGLTYQDIGGYKAENIEFVLGFDIDERKVGKHLSKAIFAKPNCNMRVIEDEDYEFTCISPDATVFTGPALDGVADHMRDLPSEVTFVETSTPAVTEDIYIRLLKEFEVDVLLNYMPVGADEASKFYIENAIKAGVSVVNCMPSYISTEDAKALERLAIENGVTIVGSDMRSQFGASRLSEVLLGSCYDSGLLVTQHIQMNMAAGTTQGDNRRTGRTANTDFLNMAAKERLHNKWISKEAVLKGQAIVRGVNVAGTTMYAGPSLTVFQKPGAEYVGSDNKIANIDMVMWGWAGARYELTARLSVQDSPNSSGIVFDAIRFCQVANEMNIRGYLRGPSAVVI